jgi:hypothetical protein
VEYIREDLSVTGVAPVVSGAPAGSLLSGEEKVGVARLVESLQCCMWSNMIKKPIAPP